MTGNKESFLATINECEDESEIDYACFTWLKLLCMDFGKDGERASKLLDIVRDILEA